MSQRFVFRMIGLLAVPGVAQAHLITTGLGPLYDGLGHFALSLECLLPVMALALLAGLNGVQAARWCLWCLPTAWLAGGLLGMLLPSSYNAELGSPYVLMALGTLVGFAVKLSAARMAGLACMLGFALGYLDTSGLAATSLGLVGLLGVCMPVFVLTALIAAGVLALQHAWMRVAIRATGSWIAASGLLLLGWTLR